MSLQFSQNFKHRLLFSSIFLLILTAVIYLSANPLFQPFFTLLLAIVVGSALWEFYQMSRKKGLEPLEGIGIIGSAFYLYTMFLNTQANPFNGLPLIVLGIMFFATFLPFFFSQKNPLLNISVTLFGVAYLTLPLSSVLPINFDHGRFWLAYLIIVTKITDTGAYFSGKWWGKNKMAPTISPKKTWEGSIGGFMASITASVALYFVSEAFSLSHFFTFFQSIWLGAILSILAQIGDLCESLLKRDSGISDSSHLPGLGGVLDIVDSLVFTAPMLYLFLSLT